MIAGLVLAVSVVVIALLASPIPALALLSLVVGFVTHVVCADPDHHVP